MHTNTQYKWWSDGLHIDHRGTVCVLSMVGVQSGIQWILDTYVGTHEFAILLDHFNWSYHRYTGFFQKIDHNYSFKP